jgi:hypothetical protein
MNTQEHLDHFRSKEVYCVVVLSSEWQAQLVQQLVPVLVLVQGQEQGRGRWQKQGQKQWQKQGQKQWQGRPSWQAQQMLL